MRGKNLESMTKEELLALAAKYKVPVKRSVLKNEIVALLKEGLDKIKKTKAPAKIRKTGRGKPVSQKTAKGKTEKGPVSAKSAGKAKRREDRAQAGAPARDTSRAPTHAYLPEMIAEVPAQEAKFLIGRPEIRDEMRDETVQELPSHYGENQLILMVRDPYWVYSYWEVRREKIEEGVRALGSPLHEMRWILRVHPAMSAGAASSFKPFDVEIDPNARNWYLHLSPPGASFYAELGLLDRSGKFFRLVLSNTVTLPSDRPSDIIDERWMTTEEEFKKLYAMSGGFRLGAGSEALRQDQRLPFGMFSGAVSSFSSAELQARRERKFWFWVDAELIVYGGTEASAKVTLGGQRIQLRHDGTFSARFALPDGTLTIPVCAESEDGIETRAITPVVSRRTERPEPVFKKED